MTRQEHIAKLEKRIKRANAMGDYIGADNDRLLLEDLKKVTDKEYAVYIKLRGRYAEHSTISGIQSTRIHHDRRN